MPQPDLAAGEPEVSPDGLTWTFRLKPGLRYAPPFDEHRDRREETSSAPSNGFSVLRSTSWTDATGRPYIGAYSYYYDSVIEGARAFADGKADSISGLETPDEHTLVVHLLEPTGDLAVRFSLPATAPIPPGADDGHDDGYGPYLVASGPYLVEGYDAGRSLTLARNPSWERGRTAFGGLRRPHRAVSSEARRPRRSTRSRRAPRTSSSMRRRRHRMLERYGADTDLRSRLAIFPLDAVRYVMMNLAVPPFDELAVRQAANLVVDKEALLASYGKDAVPGSIASHIAPELPREQPAPRLRPVFGPVRGAARSGQGGACPIELRRGRGRALRRERLPRHPLARAGRGALSAGGEARRGRSSRQLGIDVSLAVRDPDAFFEELLDPALTRTDGRRRRLGQGLPERVELVHPALLERQPRRSEHLPRRAPRRTSWTNGDTT